MTPYGDRWRAGALGIVATLGLAGGAGCSALPSGESGSPGAVPAVSRTGSAIRDAAPIIRAFPTKDSRLQSPFELSFNRHGRLWFTASSPHVGFVRSVGSFGSRNLPIKTGPAGPERANQMAQGPDGRVWFTDYYGGTLGTIDQAGHAKQYYPFSGGYSSGLVTGPDGRLWVLLTGDYTNLEQVDTSHKVPRVVHSYELDGGYQETIAVGSDGNFWVGGSNRLQVVSRVTPDGDITDFPLSATDGVWGVTLGPDGNIWLTGATDAKFHSYVSKITPLGAITEFRIRSQGDGIVAGPDGNVWFTEPYEGLIGKVTMAGKVSEYAIPGTVKHSAPNYQDTGIVAGPDGNLWFTEPMQSKIGEVVLSPSG